MIVPEERGPLSTFVLEALATQPRQLPRGPQVDVTEPLGDDDLHLALSLCYELHNGGLAWADEGWEWEPSLIAFRVGLERVFEQALVEHVGRGHTRQDVPGALRAMVAEDRSPSLSGYLADRGTPEQFAEFVVHRSFYQLREADPHSWAIPRLRGAGKAALVMVQVDEYGNGREERMHSSLFRRTMEAFELDTREGVYLDLLPGPTLATVNLMMLFGLHRRWRGAVAGHLAVFEMTSTGPNRRYGDGLRRLGFGQNATEFFDEHVTADAVHELIACDDMAGAIAAASPELAPDIVFGGACLLALERRFAAELLGAWARDRTSLRRPLFASLAA
jgi:hypothetical protein